MGEGLSVSFAKSFSTLLLQLNMGLGMSQCLPELIGNRALDLIDQGLQTKERIVFGMYGILTFFCDFSHQMPLGIIKSSIWTSSCTLPPRPGRMQDHWLWR